METPTDNVFKAMQGAAIAVWSGYDDTHGYATEKIQHVQQLINIADNWYTIWGMFDFENRVKFRAILDITSEEAATWSFQQLSGEM